MKKLLALFIIFILLIGVYLSINGINFDRILSIIKISIPIYKASEKDEMFIFVDIRKNTLSVYKECELVKSFAVATGKEETPSPIGTFKIINKGSWGKGFGGHWMGLNVPWGTFGIHGTNIAASIGTAASHGCIRMRPKDAEKLYKMVKIGTIVEISGGPFGAFGSGFRTIYPGDRGADVMEIQRILKYKGYYFGAIDGKYGISMEKALLKYQQDNDLILNNRITIAIYKKLGIILAD